MAEFNLIQRPDLILRLQQMLGLRQAHVVPSLSETVQPVVIFGDVRDTGGERQVVRAAWGAFSVGGLVGNPPRGGIVNPAGSKTIVTVTAVFVSNPQAGSAGDRFVNFKVFGPGTVTFGNPTPDPPQFRTVRGIDPTGSGAVNQPVGQISGNNNAAVLAGSFQVCLAADGGPLLVEARIVLLPGWGLGLGVPSLAATAALSAGFLWEEEDLEQRA